MLPGKKSAYLLPEIAALKSGIRDVLLRILIDPKNQFEKKDFFIVSQLLWGIESFPKVEIPYTRLGVVIDHGSYLEEMVIRAEIDSQILSLEGIERTGYASDSYEKEFITLNYDHVECPRETLVVDLNKLNDWCKETIGFIEDEEKRYTIEYFGFD